MISLGMHKCDQCLLERRAFCPNYRDVTTWANYLAGINVYETTKRSVKPGTPHRFSL